MAYSAWSVTFGEQPSAAKWNILGTNDAHFYGFLGDNEDWQTWAPTYANLTVNNGTVTARYTKIGNTVVGMWNLLVGSSTSIGSSVTVSAPVTALAGYGSLDNVPIGNLLVLDSGTAVYSGVVQLDRSATVMALRYEEVPTGTHVRAQTTIPITETTGDNWAINFTYEAAA